MNVEKTALPGVLLIEPRVFRDERGFFYESYQAERYQQAGVPSRFVQDNISRSEKGVLRGMHYQLGRPQAKLVYVIRGEVFDVAVDIRKGSPTFGQWVGYHLSDENQRQLYIPEGFAHGFQVISEVADFFYKCSDYYADEEERGVCWDDPDIGIAWPVANSILAPRDASFPLLREIESDLPKMAKKS